MIGSAAPEVLTLRALAGHSSLGALGRVYDFGLQAGQVGVIIGGKDTSSLFRLIMGLGGIESGTIDFMGGLIFHRNTRSADFNSLRQKIGFVFRDKGLLADLSLRDNTDLPAKYHGRYIGREEQEGTLGEQALIEMGVDPPWHDKLPSDVSGEVRKKALLARAIVLQPRVLIMDDPTLMMPSPLVPELIRWIKGQASRGRAVLVGTRDYAFAVAVADWILHPTTGRPVKNYEDFIPYTWLKMAAVLSLEVRQSA